MTTGPDRGPIKLTDPMITATWPYRGLTELVIGARVAARRAEAWRMRSDGATWQQVADALGYYSKGAAWTDVHREGARRANAARKAARFMSEQHAGLGVGTGDAWRCAWPDCGRRLTARAVVRDVAGAGYCLRHGEHLPRVRRAPSAALPNRRELRARYGVEPPDPVTVACPSCEARPGAPCTSPTPRKRSGWSHRDRHSAAYRPWIAEQEASDAPT